MFKKSVINFLCFVVTGIFITSCNQAENAQTIQNTSVKQTSSTITESQTKMQVDQPFIEMMIPHHQGAVEMAELALNKAKHPELKNLAKSIINDQNKEIQQMQSWYKKWYPNQTSNSSDPGMIDHSLMDHSMMSMMQMSKESLKTASNFDQEFIQQMIPHHQSAVMMAQMVINTAEHPEIRNLAKSIIKSQTAEIQKMQQWEQTWYK